MFTFVCYFEVNMLLFVFILTADDELTTQLHVAELGNSQKCMLLVKRHCRPLMPRPIRLQFRHTILFLS